MSSKTTIALIKINRRLNVPVNDIPLLYQIIPDNVPSPSAKITQICCFVADRPSDLLGTGQNKAFCDSIELVQGIEFDDYLASLAIFAGFN